MSKRILSILAVIMVMGFVAAAFGSSYIFQDGLNGYAGTRDDQIATNYGDVNRGGLDYAGFQGVPYGGTKRPGFIAFDAVFGNGANQVSVTTQITSATLRLYVFEKLVVSGSNYIQIWPMATPWVEGAEASFGITPSEGSSTAKHRYFRNSGIYAPGDYWGNGDSSAITGPVSGVDYNVEGDNSMRSVTYFTSDTLNVPVATGEWMEFDVTDAVKKWQDGTMDNNGFYGYSNGYWQHVLWHSSEYADASLRPMLVIVPEPATMLLLAAGLMTLRRQRA